MGLNYGGIVQYYEDKGTHKAILSRDSCIIARDSIDSIILVGRLWQI